MFTKTFQCFSTVSHSCSQFPADRADSMYANFLKTQPEFYFETAYYPHIYYLYESEHNFKTIKIYSNFPEYIKFNNEEFSEYFLSEKLYKKGGFTIS